MWRLTTDPLPNRAGTHHQVLTGDAPLTYRAVLDLWRESEPFRAFWTNELAQSPYRGFRWETPPIRHATVDRSFEFVLLDAPELARAIDRRSFSEHYADAERNGGVVAIENLGGDAMLVIPGPQVSDDAYGHLAAFVREAPTEQQHALWRAVSAAADARLGEQPLWLSTAGMGVSWLHVRLDSRPKYYGHAPYRHDA